MSNDRFKILQLLDDGEIDADEAGRRLDALVESQGAAEESDDSGVDQVVIGAPLGDDAPDFDRFRSFWRIPFGISLGGLILMSLWLGSAMAGSEGRLTFWMVACLWPMLIFAALAASLTFMSQWSTWLHVRVEEKDGARIAVSLPVPLGLFGMVVGVARPFVPEGVGVHLGDAEAILEQMGKDRDPFVINVDDGDGDKVRIYFG